VTDQIFFEGVPDSLKPSLFGWLTPFLRSADFLHLVERRFGLALDWQYGEHSAIEDLAAKMVGDDELYLDILRLAIDRIHMGYSVQDEQPQLRELEEYLKDARSVWRVDVQHIPTGKPDHSFSIVRTLQRRTPATSVPEAERHTSSERSAPQRAVREPAFISRDTGSEKSAGRKPATSLVQSAERWYHDRSLVVQILTLVIGFLTLLATVAAIIVAVLIGNGTIKP
jgi:hypothetical protein